MKCIRNGLLLFSILAGGFLLIVTGLFYLSIPYYWVVSEVLNLPAKKEGYAIMGVILYGCLWTSILYTGMCCYDERQKRRKERDNT